MAALDTVKKVLYYCSQLEKDNFDLESIQHKIDRENKSLLREVERLKQSVEVKDVMLEDMNSKRVVRYDGEIHLLMMNGASTASHDGLQGGWLHPWREYEPTLGSQQAEP